MMESEDQQAPSTLISEDAEAISPPPVPRHPNYGKPWGFWVTLVLGIGIMGAWLFAQIIVGVVMVFVEFSGTALDQEAMRTRAAEFEFDGFVLGLSSFVALPVALIGCVGLAALRKSNGIRIRDYLALKPMRSMDWWYWPVTTICVGLLLDRGIQLLGAPPENEWMKNLATKGTHFPWIIATVVICAPLVEEFVFRGFLFKGWKDSVGVWPTIVLTSFLWTIIHVQYGWHALLFIFLLGIFLGYARAETKSIWPPILIHFVNNSLAGWSLWNMMEAVK